MMEISHEYDDIIRMPHHVSETRPHMPLTDRAAQFSPFAALTGYEDAITETGRLTDRKKELTDERKQEISAQLRKLKPGDEVTVTCWEPDAKKEGGAYRTRTGRVKKADPLTGLLELKNGAAIPFEDILELE